MFEVCAVGPFFVGLCKEGEKKGGAGQCVCLDVNQLTVHFGREGTLRSQSKSEQPSVTVRSGSSRGSSARHWEVVVGSLWVMEEKPKEEKRKKKYTIQPRALYLHPESTTSRHDLLLAL